MSKESSAKEKIRTEPTGKRITTVNAKTRKESLLADQAEVVTAQLREDLLEKSKEKRPREN